MFLLATLKDKAIMILFLVCKPQFPLFSKVWNPFRYIIRRWRNVVPVFVEREGSGENPVRFLRQHKCDRLQYLKKVLNILKSLKTCLKDLAEVFGLRLVS